MPRGPLPEDPAVRALIAQARSRPDQPPRPDRRRGRALARRVPGRLLRACRRIRPRRVRQRGGGPFGVGEDADLGELVVLPRRGRRRQPPDARGVHGADRTHGQLRRLDRRQQHLLREGARSARPRPGHRRGRRLPHRLDGVDLDRVRLHAGVRPGEHAQRRGEPQPQPAEPGLRPGPGELAAVAVRLRRHRVEQGEAPAGPAERRRPVGPELQGRVGVLSEMRDTMGLIMLSQGVDISGSSWGDTEFQNALDVFAEQVSNGQIRNIKGNSYADDLKNEDTLAAIVWSGDITAINARGRRQVRLRPARLGRHAVERQLHDPDRLAAEGQRREAHRLLLRPARRGRGRRVGELHHPRRRCAGGDGRDRPGAWSRTSSSSRTRRRCPRRTSSARSRTRSSRSTTPSSRPSASAPDDGRGSVRRVRRRSAARRDPQDLSRDSPRSRSSTC